MNSQAYLQAQGQSGSGMTSGASNHAGRRPGLVHLFDTTTQLTGCGRAKGSGTLQRPAAGQPGATPDRMLTCPKCRQIANV